MILSYEEMKEDFGSFHRISRHMPPHLHNSIEFVYVTEGTLELGTGYELYHMEKGDLAIVFPEVIHHYQVFSQKTSTAYYIYASQNMSGPFLEQMQKYCLQVPVIKKEELHRDVINAIECLAKEKDLSSLIIQAYVQIILSRCIPHLKLVEKSSIGSNDIVYLSVSYILNHFREQITLGKMAADIGVSKYVLSRVFSGTFHRNFNQYLNEARLDYACSLLENTSRAVTDICMDSGFESQRTFNRAFRQRYRMTPRDYRSACKNILYNSQFIQ
ncbi:MAG: helix-turn-helix transcriptional regulator [Lachnospiraceae bacterium]|nr:helix-turn-helix transcriptional regulator [Lachnospiraceae bacterium]